MAAEKQQLPPTSSADLGVGEEAEQREEITLFAPFGAQKPTRSLFQRSSDYESEFSDSKSDSKSREIEFQSSETQTAGNAKVLFRKLKAVVSGTSTSSLSMSSAQETPSVDNSARGYWSKASPTPSVGSSINTATGTADQASLYLEPSVTLSVEQGLSDEPKISLTSYSDAHSHRVKRTAHPGGGVARPQSQAVNKTEMLKRFGNIADNTVQVRKGTVFICPFR